MVTVRGLASVAALWLASGVVAQANPAVADPVAAACAEFPDNGLPGLLSRLDRSAGWRDRDREVYAQLAALGPAAHEALLGWLGRCDRPRDEKLLAAFGEFDAHAAWALPLLLDDFVLADPVAQELLCRLGPAAAPALPELTRRAAGKTWLAPIVARLAQASDAPWTAGSSQSRPRVRGELVPALLERIGSAGAVPRWPVLQALLTAGDEAATAAFEVLHELALQPAMQPGARELQLALRCVYGARCLQGFLPLQGVAPAELPIEARRLLLAGRTLRPEDVAVWVRSPDARLRRTAFLALLGSDGRYFADNQRLPPTPDADADVQRSIELVRRVDRVLGATAAREAMEALAGATVDAKAKALLPLAGKDLSDAPAEFWSALCAMACGADAFGEAVHPGQPPGAVQYRHRTVLGSSIASVLQATGRDSRPQPPALTAALLHLQPCRENEQLMRELLDAASPGELQSCIRKAAEDAPQLARWIGFLRGANSSKRMPEVLASVGQVLAERIAVMPPPTQLDWLELGAAATVPDAVWVALLRSPEVAERRRAIEAAWRGFSKRPIDLALVVPCLEDADAEVARSATFLLGACETDPARAVAALVARYATAPAELQAWLVRALFSQREHCAAPRATLDAAFASEHWQVRLPAACALLALEPRHESALAVLTALGNDERAEVRLDTLWLLANDRSIAERFVDRALALLEDPDYNVRHGAVRLLGEIPSAKDRSLPALRALLTREPRTLLALRAERAIADLEK